MTVTSQDPGDLRPRPPLARNQGLHFLPLNLSLLLQETKSLGFQGDKEEATRVYLSLSENPPDAGKQLQ